MSKGIDPGYIQVCVTRAVNGWVVVQDHLSHGTRVVHVARTPKELADLLQEWAQQQTDMPSTP